ncbi:monovalent cation/H(+) antiporter subunit G [Natronobacterium gregoryi]|uniref:Monovalent cation/H+ antiporter subunit G n=2 Tax=Natronobacterium gregoryi TaxID=44930 RepID=L0AJY8_NATGS|nr:monovalent cation/H(+) antiporter subunit G [Natronobacterium gregoryi]AFZ74198.1 monovalent cation/proton antiporter, MnhG/PhaG subunit [Natronobacterium gregoryi SP2]ELY63653.1 monovalent cation/H+ antiporter subunit G [Natronobacterium gregoryi SP2]PLK22012.1 Na+/H+ antiporter subunit G [Natronobacterium gregoryi SP2]SFI51310.1 multisubunit sodium/proton antiporter, MrpG subunit [Natronobacterium gregoryi]
MTFVTAVVVLLVVLGVFFTMVAAVGMLRLPDIYTRSHAATKADTLGAGFSILAVGIYFGTAGELLRAGLLLVFIYITNPTAAHAVTRAAYSQDIEVWTVDGNDEEGAR